MRLDSTQYGRIFGSLDPFPYNRAFVQQIEAARRSLDGSLFIERVLKALNLSNATNLYPPRNEAALRKLFEHICESTNATVHHKASVVFYLLLDVDERNGVDRAQYIADQLNIPENYKIFIQGLWYMDNQSFDVALQYLTHPSLQPDFVDDIVSVLVRHAPDGDYSLPLAYYQTVQPLVQSPSTLELLFRTLARSSIVDAFQFSRSHADFMRRQLFQRLVLTALESAGGDESGERALSLISLPFDAHEEQWFKECLESGEGKRLAVARDALLMRKIATNQATFGSETGTWAVVLEGFKAGSGGRVQA
ncbi:nuclear pore complex assembly-domain-containing protein [Hypoxylon rubiginosum]|uniref:Nuclear pore complex assembly-domain-containing protein n=1 Tax=Hypoxylon rubiginosum TaxID=110542 RepID=A0ACB9YQ60_9PEZI|nr:nuclear pore complex assembly-domain-containing protein [Hypoxylon rubiginosum]